MLGFRDFQFHHGTVLWEYLGVDITTCWGLI